MACGRKVQLGTLPVPSTTFTSDVVLEAPLGTVALSFEFRRDGEPYRGDVRFDKVRAYASALRVTVLLGTWKACMTPSPRSSSLTG